MKLKRCNKASARLFPWKRKGKVEMETSPNTVKESIKRSKARPRIHRRFKSALVFAISLAGGIAIGIVLHPSSFGRELNPAEKAYLRFPGEMYIRMLKILVVPLILGATVSKAAQLPFKSLRTLGLCTACVFFVSSLSAEIIGLLMSALIRPGSTAREVEVERGHLSIVAPAAIFQNFVQTFVPDNIVRAMFSKEFVVPGNIFNNDHRVSQVFNETLAAIESVGHNLSASSMELVKQSLKRRQKDRAEETRETNFNGVIAFSIFMGFGIGNLGTETSTLSTLFQNLCKVTLNLVSVVLWYSPIGIMFLIASDIVDHKHFQQCISKYYLYAMTELTALAIYAGLALPLVFYGIVRQNAFKYTGNMIEAVGTALGTSSSRATYPVTIFCLACEPNLDFRVVPLVNSTGNSLHAPGEVMHNVIFLHFLADAACIELSVGDYVLIIVFSHLVMLADFTGAPLNITNSSLGPIAKSMGLPHYRAFSIQISPIDWLMSCVRTLVDVYANCICVAIVARLCRAHLPAIRKANNNKVPKRQKTKKPGGSVLGAARGVKQVLSLPVQFDESTLYLTSFRKLAKRTLSKVAKSTNLRHVK